MQVQQEAWEHLVKFHGNGSTFDLVLDRATTQQMIETLLRLGRSSPPALAFSSPGPTGPQAARSLSTVGVWLNALCQPCLMT